MTAFLDTNIFIALLNESDKWHAWSVATVTDHKTRGPAIIADIVYCEASVAMKDRSDLDGAITHWGLERLAENDDVLFRAGKAFKQYRTDKKGPKLGVLPDFLIGALAETFEAPLITANARDFVGYFPNVACISPK
jgi:predicted nucleic acid-binding protein